MYIAMQKTVFWIHLASSQGGFALSPDQLKEGLSKVTTI